MHKESQVDVTCSHQEDNKETQEVLTHCHHEDHGLSEWTAPQTEMSVISKTPEELKVRYDEVHAGFFQNLKAYEQFQRNNPDNLKPNEWVIFKDCALVLRTMNENEAQEAAQEMLPCFIAQQIQKNSVVCVE